MRLSKIKRIMQNEWKQKKAGYTEYPEVSDSEIE